MNQNIKQLISDFLAKASDLPKIISIAGPTASGKTSLSIDIAKAFNGEVISVDSRQFYKRLDIGSAKVTVEEQDSVPHHFLDFLELDQEYNLFDFKKDCLAKIAEIHSRGKLPILAGGTMMYLEAIIYDYTLESDQINWNQKEKWRQLFYSEEWKFENEKIISRGVPLWLPHLIKLKDNYKNEEWEFFNKEFLEEVYKLESGPKFLWNFLKKIDEQSAQKIHPNNIYHLIRALEIIFQYGQKPSILKKKKISNFDNLYLGIKREREETKKRILLRTNLMLKDGFIKEVEDIVADYGKIEANGDIILPNILEKTIGYKEVINYLQSPEKDRAKLIEEIAIKTRQYAKRQMTWWRRDKNIVWLKGGNF